MTTEYSGSGDLRRSLELLWRGRERSPRGPKPGLDLAKIVSAAIEVADADGLAALSMRRVAAVLGVGVMSLYRYVPGKSELLDLMLDHVSAPEELPEDAALGWRDFLEQEARGHWELCLRHPWYPFVDQARPLLGPNGLRSMEHMVRHLHGTGLSDQEIIMVISTQSAFVESAARTHISQQQAEGRTGVSSDEFWSVQEPMLVEAMESGDYPTMSQLSENTFAFSNEEFFEFGLARLLDGLAAIIDGGEATRATGQDDGSTGRSSH